MSWGTVVSNVEIRIIGNSAGAVGATNQATGALGQFRSAALRVRDALGLVTAAYAGWRALTMVKDQAKALVDTGAAFQQLNYSVREFVADGAEASELMGRLEKLGLKAFGIENTTRAFISLSHIGLSPTMEQLEGIMGYLIKIGKTSPDALTDTMEILTTLGQTGNVGVEDSFKELTARLPFAMSALKEYLGKSFLELMTMFRQRQIDFGTIIQAIFEYAEKYFRNGIEDGEQLWNVLIMQWSARIELFRKQVMDSGAMQDLTTWMQRVIKEFDESIESGEFAAWANEVGEEIRKIISIIAGGDVNLQDFKDWILATAKALREITPSVVAFGESLASVMGTFGRMIQALEGGGLTSIATHGIIGKFLFGTYGMVIMASIAAVEKIMNKMSAWDPMWGAQLAQSMSPAEIASESEAIQRGSPGGSRRGLGGVEQIEQARLRQNAYKESFKNMVGERLANAAQMLQDSQNVLTAERNAGKKMAEMNKEAPGSNPYYQQYMQLDNRTRAQEDRLARDMRTAGKSGWERRKAEIESELASQLAFYDEKIKAAQKIKEMAIKAGTSTAEAEEMIAKAEKQRADYKAGVEEMMSKEAARWAEKDSAKTDQLELQVVKFMNDIEQAYNKIKGIKEQHRIEGLEAEGSIVEAEVEKIKLDAQRAKDELKKMYDTLMEEKQRIENAYKAAGQTTVLDSPLKDGSSRLEAIKRMLEEIGRSLDENMLKKLRDAEVMWIQQQETTANMALEVARLTHNKEQEHEVTVWLLQLERERLMAAAGNNEAQQKVADTLMKQKQIMEEMKAHGSIMDGFKYGWSEYFSKMQTDFELGKGIFNSFIGTVDSAADALAEFFATGKMDMQNFAESMIRDIMRIINKWILMQLLFGGDGKGGLLGGLFGGLFGGFSGFGCSGGTCKPPGFARGGIVYGPTLFPFASGIGLIGEAGAEAILPLKRTAGGNLGVTADGMGLTVNVYEAPGTKARVEREQDGSLNVIIEQVEQALVSRMHRGSGMSGYLNQKYRRRM